MDVPVNKRHLDMMLSHILLWRPRAVRRADRQRARRGFGRHGEILFGDDFVDKNTVLYGVSNTNAPLVMDEAMSGSLKVYARNNQAVACTPWMITGAMSPCTEAGTLAQLLAEALASCALTQLIRPGYALPDGQFRHRDVDAVGRADLRHAGSRKNGARRRPAGAPARRAVPHGRQPDLVQAARCAGAAGRLR